MIIMMIMIIVMIIIVIIMVPKKQLSLNESPLRRRQPFPRIAVSQRLASVEIESFYLTVALVSHSVVARHENISKLTEWGETQ